MIQIAVRFWVILFPINTYLQLKTILDTSRELGLKKETITSIESATWSHALDFHRWAKRPRFVQVFKASGLFYENVSHFSAKAIKEFYILQLKQEAIQ
ncbi:MAG: hypothetical protein IPO21_12500 [Bacteroidales bacterium]|nr:hypothetical protein [Bacteroidales bacterium]